MGRRGRKEEEMGGRREGTGEERGGMGGRREGTGEEGGERRNGREEGGNREERESTHDTQAHLHLQTQTYLRLFCSESVAVVSSVAHHHSETYHKESSVNIGATPTPRKVKDGFHRDKRTLVVSQQLDCPRVNTIDPCAIAVTKGREGVCGVRREVPVTSYLELRGRYVMEGGGGEGYVVEERGMWWRRGYVVEEGVCGGGSVKF